MRVSAAGRRSHRAGVAALAVGLVALALAGCGGEEPAPEPAGGSVDEPVRLGCGEYCQQAGGYGGGSTAKPMMAINPTSPVEALPDGTMPIALTCRFESPCEGAIVLFSEDLGGSTLGDAGRSDLAVDAGSSRTLAVELSDPARELLQERGQIDVVVNADLFPTLETLPVRERDEWSALVTREIAVFAAGS